MSLIRNNVEDNILLLLDQMPKYGQFLKRKKKSVFGNIKDNLGARKILL